MVDLRPHIIDDSLPTAPMSEKELAKRWQKSERTLQRWRSQGYGPPYLCIGGTIHYRVRDILDFEDSVRFGWKRAR